MFWKKPKPAPVVRHHLFVVGKVSVASWKRKPIKVYNPALIDSGGF